MLIFGLFGDFHMAINPKLPLLAGCRDLRVWAVSTGRRESKNRKL
jgi:hypothetical protein